jgi:tetratricopeptide (TPR) repeat protein
MKIRQGIANQQPNDLYWQRQVAISYTLLCDLYRNSGDLTNALVYAKDAIRVSKRVAEGDPLNMKWQWDYALARLTTGYLLMATDDEEAGADLYNSGTQAAEMYVNKQKNNVFHVHDLILFKTLVGDLLSKKNRWEEALQEYRSELLLRERFPTNTPEYQLELSDNHRRIGMLSYSANNASTSLREFTAALECLRKYRITTANGEKYLELEADFLDTIGQCSLACNDPNNALVLLHDSMRLREYVGKLSKNVVSIEKKASSYYTIGCAYRTVGDLTNAVASFQHAISYTASEPRTNHTMVLFSAQCNLAIEEIFRTRKDWGKALETGYATVKLLEKLPATNQTEANALQLWSQAQLVIGNNLVMSGEIGRALSPLQMALGGYCRLALMSPPSATGITLKNMVSAIPRPIGDSTTTMVNQMQLAITAYQQLQYGIDRILNTSLRNPEWMKALNNSLSSFRENLSLFDQLLVKNSGNQQMLMNCAASGYYRYAATMEAFGRIDESLEGYRLSVKIIDKMVQSSLSPTDTAGFIGAYNAVGRILLTKNDIDGALIAITKAQTAFEKQAIKNHKNTYWQRSIMYSCLDAARANIAQSDLVKADIFLRKAISIGEGLLKTDTRNVDWLKLQWIACWYMTDLKKRLNRNEETRQWYNRSIRIFSQLKQAGGVTVEDERFQKQLERLGQ